MLLSGGPPTAQDHPLADYHYAGSDRWTAEEKEAFQKAFHTYGKDFHLIQKQIPSKTVAQCVEYYYCWKKEQKLASSTLAQTAGKRKRRKSPPRKETGETGKRSRSLKPSRRGTSTGEDIAHARMHSLSPRRKGQISPAFAPG
ncbi:zinc finger protein 541-like isoform X2 [Passer domesticus]|uniref:zinc finger protein 541-like isoform X2 n=1 Tax=Passer domesticus TaxID=48849 RepID=UPI0030FE251B